MTDEQVLQLQKQLTTWYVRRESDGRVLGRDGKWRKHFAGIENIRFYSTVNRAVRYGLRWCVGARGKLYQCVRVMRLTCTDT